MIGILTFFAVILVLIAILKLSKSFDRFIVLFSKELFDRQEERKRNRQSERDKYYYVSELQRRTGDIKKR